MEGVECACMGRGRVCAYGRGRVCVHGEVEGVYMEGVECAYGRGRVCIDEERMRVWKVLSVHALGEGGHVHMEVVECACMGRGRACAHGRGGVCVHE